MGIWIWWTTSGDQNSCSQHFLTSGESSRSSSFNKWSWPFLTRVFGALNNVDATKADSCMKHNTVLKCQRYHQTFCDLIWINQSVCLIEQFSLQLCCITILLKITYVIQKLNRFLNSMYESNAFRMVLFPASVPTYHTNRTRGPANAFQATPIVSVPRKQLIPHAMFKLTSAWKYNWSYTVIGCNRAVLKVAREVLSQLPSGLRFFQRNS